MEYFLSILVLVLLYVILASSLNLILGFGGLVSIAHPAFFALGAYTSALLAKNGVWIPLALAAGALLAGFVSLGLSLPSLRVSGDYLLIASIGFQLGIVEVVNNASWTGGPGGLTNIPALFDGPGRVFIYIALLLVVAAISVLSIRNVMTGPYGRAVTAMRDDERAFLALGRNAMHIKISIFALGSALAGLAGGLYAHFFQFVSPEQFGIVESAAILTMVVVGGMGTIWGPILGAALLIVLPQAITFLDLPTQVAAALRGMLFTGLVLIFLFLRPQGIVESRPGSFLGPVRTAKGPATGPAVQEGR